MPNGDDAPLIRLCASIDGFRARYERWPTRVRIYPEALECVRHLLTPAALARLSAQVTLVPDNSGAIIAEDDSGGSYHYGQEGFTPTPPTPNTWKWLNAFGSGDT